MTRYFKVTLDVLSDAYDQVRVALGQPHGYAEEPFPRTGDFNNGTHGFLAFGPHHTTGDYEPLISNFLGLPGVEEITREQYFAAMPEPEPL